jgi:hypothetical protein
MNSPHLTKLQELTHILPSLTGIIKDTNTLNIEYETKDGSCFGQGIFKNRFVALQRAFIDAGATLHPHDHKEVEWLIVTRGKVSIELLSGITELSVGDGIRVEPNTGHILSALEDSWIIGITIPASEAYPNGR